MLSFELQSPTDSSAPHVAAGVSIKQAESGLNILQATEPSVNGFRQLDNQDSPAETPGKLLKVIFCKFYRDLKFPIYIHPLSIKLNYFL